MPHSERSEDLPAGKPLGVGSFTAIQTFLLMNLVLNYFWWSRLFNFFNYLFDNFIISKMMSTAKWTFISINNLLSLGNLISSFSNMAYWRPSFRISFNFFVLRVWLQMLVCRRGSV